ncbi:hypothetical protein F5Y16DRAFT_357651 [Xylariaceae sp. FL0255]|nr:hypothetical protein F5Y16DRAFT_357651 [Xylariaceae sp. FL0255]
MAEALAVIGLASNVIQFVELGFKFAQKYHKAYAAVKSQPIRHEELQADVEEIKASAADLSSERLGKASELSGSEKRLNELCTQCRDIGNELIALLDPGKVSSGKGAWVAFKRTLDSSKDEKIKNLKDRMDSIRIGILLCLSGMMRDQQSKMVRSFGTLLAENERLRASTVENFQAVRSDLAAILERSPSLKDVNKNRKAATILSSELIQQLLPQLRLLADTSDRARRVQNVLSSLTFHNIRARFWSIKKSHTNTFEWMFRPPDHEFANWLKSKDSMFWICGKAGSGKSTLMRFLAEHYKTRSNLEIWAGGQKLVLASHYFCVTGTSIQRSRAGLFRTLLYQFFSQCPELIQTLCPSRWETTLETQITPWDDEELRQALESFSRARDLSTKFCLFVDGLDEYTAGQDSYHGSYTELIEPLRALSESTSIKICVSSRPWTAFEKSFGNSPNHLRLENLTRNDIRLYINDRLGENRDFKALSRQDKRLELFVDSIVQRAQGVFLWVYLVVDSLLNGISAEDDFTDLQKRLDQLPPELEPYFRHMLESVESVYWDQAVRIFHTTIDADQSLPLLAYEFLDYEKNDPSFALKLSFNTARDLDMPAIYGRMRKRLNARCKDLLEVVEDPEEQSTVMRLKVNFLHRTVRDFFRDTDVISEIMSQREKVHLNTNLSLARIMLALVKTAHAQAGPIPNINHALALTDGLMYYAWKQECELDDVNEPSQETSLGDMFKLLDELDRVNIECLQRHGEAHWTNIRDTPKGLFGEYQQKSFLAAVIQARLRLYLASKLEEDSRLLQKRGRPLLDYALRPTMVTPLEFADLEQGPNLEIVELLLKKGSYPNHGIYIYDGQTPWELFLRTCYDHFKGDRRQEHSPDVIYRVMRLMLLSGADPWKTFHTAGGSYLIQDVIDICRLNQNQVAELVSIIEDKKSERSRKRLWLPRLW